MRGRIWRERKFLAVRQPKSYSPAPAFAAMTKYVLAYALLALFVGLGTYILCRPSRRFEGDR